MPRAHYRWSMPRELPVVSIGRFLQLQKCSLRRRKIFLQQHKEIGRYIAIVDIVTMSHQALIYPAAVDGLDALDNQRNNSIAGALLRMKPLGHDER